MLLQSDYLRKISLKMLTLETKSQNPMANPLQPNAASTGPTPPDQGSTECECENNFALVWHCLSFYYVIVHSKYC